MALIGIGVNKLKRRGLFIPLIAMVVLAAALALAAEPFVVAPVNKPEDLRLLPSGAWPPPESDPAEMLIKLTYLRGLLDALQYAEVAPKSASKALKDLSGMTLQEVAAAVDRYYLADPRRRELPPASVVLRILPAQGEQTQPSPLPAPGVRP